MFFRQLSLITCFLILLTGCGRNDSDFKLPGVYRVNIQQGNVIEQENLDRLRVGMDKDQVRFIMGTPAVEDPFHTDRWDYIYTYTEGANRRQQQHVTMIFEDDLLVRIEGDVVAGKLKTDEEITRETKTVDVPLRKSTEKGIFSKVIDAIPFIGDDDDLPPPPKTSGNDDVVAKEESEE